MRNPLKSFLVTKLTRRRMGEFIERHASGKKTLDVGAGPSPYSTYFPNRTSLDIVEGEGVDVVGDAHELPFEDESFDVVLCTEVLEHLHSPWVAAEEMRRVLRPGGKLILTTRFIFPLHNTPYDYYRYTKYGLRHLFKGGWEIEELVDEADTKDTLAILLQRIGFQSHFYGGVIVKGLVFLTARIMYFFPSLIKHEFANIEKSAGEKHIMSTGHYMVTRKK